MSIASLGSQMSQALDHLLRQRQDPARAQAVSAFESLIAAPTQESGASASAAPAAASGTSPQVSLQTLLQDLDSLGSKIAAGDVSGAQTAASGLGGDLASLVGDIRDYISRI